MASESDGIESVLFDFGGVMIPLYEKEFSTAIMAQYHKAPKDTRVGVDTYQRLCFGLVHKLMAGLEDGAFWRLFEKGTGVPRPADPGSFLLGHYKTVKSLNPLMEGLVCQLKRSGIRVGVVSNTISAHAGHFRRMRLFDIFEPNVVLSCESNACKPDPAIWDIALRKLYAAGERSIGFDKDSGFVTRADRVAYIDDNPAFARAFEENFHGRGICYRTPSETEEMLRHFGARF